MIFISGYVQTPGYADNVTGMTPHAFIRVGVPDESSDSAIMFSVDAKTDVRRAHFALYHTRTTASYLIPSPSDGPAVLRTHVLYVSTYGISSAAFRVLFSFHNASALPEKLGGGGGGGRGGRGGRGWNCSVPHWPDFRLHFPCDLQAQCGGQEDEAECPYTGQDCGEGEEGEGEGEGEGRVRVGEKCYAVVVLPAAVHNLFFTAPARCAAVGGGGPGRLPHAAALGATVARAEVPAQRLLLHRSGARGHAPARPVRLFFFCLFFSAFLHRRSGYSSVRT